MSMDTRYWNVSAFPMGCVMWSLQVIYFKEERIMKFSKTTKKVLSLSMAAAVAAGSVAVPVNVKKADAKSYTAYLCLATKKWTFRNEHKDSKFSSKLNNTTNKKLVTKAMKKASFKNTSFTLSKKAKTFTVSLTGLNKSVMSKDGGFNTLYVDTTVPGTMKNKVKATKLVLTIDGKKYTIKNPVVTPDKANKKDNVQFMAINTWNKKIKKFSYKMPKKSITISVTAKLK